MTRRIVIAVATLVLLVAAACSQHPTATAPAPVEVAKPPTAEPPAAEPPAAEPVAGPTCEHAGKTYRVGDQYRDIDGCNNCSCVEGAEGQAHTACTDIACPNSRLPKP